MTRRLVLALIGAALSLTVASAQGGLEQRVRSLGRRIDDAYADRRISGHDVTRLHRDVDKVARRLDDARHRHGRVSPRDWERCERDLDRIEMRLRELERRMPPPRPRRDYDRRW